MKFTLKLILVFSLVWLVSRSAIYLLPGNPADFLYQEALVQTSPEALKEKLDLPDTWSERIFSIPKNQSLTKNESAFEIVNRSFFKSLVLTFLSLLFAIPSTLALLYFYFARGVSRKRAEILALILASTPVFILAPLFLRWISIPNPFPPALCLSAHLTGFWFRALSKKMDRHLPQSSVQGSRARGFSEYRIFLKDALFPLLGNFVAYFGAQLGNLFNGSLLVEVIFQWNGLGSLMAESVLSRDYPVVELSLIVVTLSTLLAQQCGSLFQKRWEKVAT